MKVAIIGCGVTGMSAGITLQKAGIDTVIFEQTDKPGGVITVYKRGDILINNAMEFVYGTKNGTFINDMWNSLGMFRTEPVHKDCFKKFSWDGNTVGIYKDFGKTVNELISLGQEDKKSMDKLYKAVKRFQKVELPFITKNSTDIFSRLVRLFFDCLAASPYVLRYGLVNGKKYSKGIKSEKLRSFFSGALNQERSLLQYLVLWSFYSAGNFSVPDNNQKEMVENLYNEYTSHGGRVEFCSKLTDVSIIDGKINSLNFSDITETDFDYVIFSGDIATVNKIMNNSGKKLPIIEKAMEKEHITSACMLYFKVLEDISSADIEALSIPSAPFSVGNRICSEFSVRTMKNPGAGVSVISVTLYQNEKDYPFWQKIAEKGEVGYRKECGRIAENVSSAIEEHFPVLKGKLENIEAVTPLTYHYFTGVNKGGWMPESWNPLLYLFYGRGHMPGIKNASLAGQKMFPIGGSTIGAFSGVHLAERLIKKNKH